MVWPQHFYTTILLWIARGSQYKSTPSPGNSDLFVDQPNHGGRCTNILQSVWLVHSHHGALIYSWSPPGIAMVVEPTDSHFDAADHLDEVEGAFFDAKCKCFDSITPSTGL